MEDEICPNCNGDNITFDDEEWDFDGTIEFWHCDDCREGFTIFREEEK